MRRGPALVNADVELTDDLIAPSVTALHPIKAVHAIAVATTECALVHCRGRCRRYIDVHAPTCRAACKRLRGWRVRLIAGSFHLDRVRFIHDSPAGSTTV